MEERARERRPFVSKFLCHNTRAMGGDHSFLAGLRGRILTLPPEISPSPRQPSAGRGLGRGASTGLQTWAAVAFRQGGLLSPTLSSKGGEGGPVVGWWQCQDTFCWGEGVGEELTDLGACGTIEAMSFPARKRWSQRVLWFWMPVGMAVVLGDACLRAASPPRPFMPRAEDFTFLWWANGPQHYLGMKQPPPEAVLCLQSGVIGLALDTKSLQFL